MQYPLQISFHKMEPTPALRSAIEKHAEKLDRFTSTIISCHVVIEPAEKHHHQGNRFAVRIRLTVPGHEFESGHTPKGNRSHQDAYVAIRDAFDAMRRQIEDFERKRRGDVKTHEEPSHGRVAQIHPAADYGIIRTLDGREIHFHRNSVIDFDFDAINTGMEVRFIEQSGEEGPWASTVHVVHPSKAAARGSASGGG